MASRRSRTAKEASEMPEGFRMDLERSKTGNEASNAWEVIWMDLGRSGMAKEVEKQKVIRMAL